MSGPKILFELPFLGFQITETIFNSWLIIIGVTILCLILTHKMEKIPRKKTQIIAEKIVISIDSIVEQVMGKKWIHFAPYILTLMVASVFGSLISLVGLRSVTADINTTATWALITFIMINYTKFKYNGFKGYFKTFAQPMAFMTPLNIVGEAALPVSMSFRHFGNIVAGYIITTLIYQLLTFVSSLFLPIPILQIGVPAFLSMYFDLFSGFMQAFIFSMLTMVFVSGAAD